MMRPSFAVTWHVPFTSISIDDAFWSPRQDLLASSTLAQQLEMLETHHHVDNFRIAAGEKDGVFRGWFFYDSDLYKWIEACSYSLHDHPDPALEAQVDDIISLIVKAQQPDGYVNTYFTTLFPKERMKYFYAMHELYNGGHLIEAAVARHVAQRKDDLLDVAKSFADFVVVMNETRHDDPKVVPGHQEIELALVRLAKATGDSKYFDLAKDLIERRGRNPHIGTTALVSGQALLRLSKAHRNALARAGIEEKETGTNTEELNEVKPSPKDSLRFASSSLSGKFEQQHAPVREQEEPVGHAVRATYMYCAMADLLLETGEESLRGALERLWTRMVQARMYVTGGIGSVPSYEGFGNDHELPNKTAYAETCAAIGSLLFNWRMFQASGEAKYGDIMELALYNGFLVGWGLDGNSYRYTNPLAADANGTEMLSCAGRKPWFPVACCPTNIGRVIASLGRFVYTWDDSPALWVNQYIGSHLRISSGPLDGLAIDATSGFPWKPTASFAIVSLPANGTGEFSLKLRVPGWARDAHAEINGKHAVLTVSPSSFLDVKGPFSEGDVVSFHCADETVFVPPDPLVKENRGRVAIRKGPVIYCVEGIDNQTDSLAELDALAVDLAVPTMFDFNNDLLGGMGTIAGQAFDDNLDQVRPFLAIPYFAWNNRGCWPMQVWCRTRK
jgi:hypothetical protein